MCELLMSNWIGNKGLIRRLQIVLRKPVHYGDITTYRGEVVKKFKESQSEKREWIAGNVAFSTVGIGMTACYAYTLVLGYTRQDRTYW
jgi:hypothetical protein